jgi:hypothetical protein
MIICDIIDYLYIHNKEEYNKFYIKIMVKEVKSINGIYIWNRILMEN